MKHILYSLAFVLLAACGGGADDPVTPGTPDNNEPEGSVNEVVNVTSDLCLQLSTDKACYQPGEQVTLTSDIAIPVQAKVRYRHHAQVISEQAVSGSEWTWTPPATDYSGYLADVYRTKDDGTEVILGTIAIDVSSDWKRFPRYGFVATFDASKRTAGVIEKEMAFLNRCHINGVQFQDWHNKHHWPLGGTRNKLDDVYKDIANRDIYTDVVKRYLEVQHAYGMKSMFYNLCFGALDDAKADGVKEEWYIYKGQGRVDKDSHDLPDSWKSDIYLLDPSNTEWQAYLAERNDEVYANLDFDGYQIDQLGYRGDRFDYNGTAVNLPKGYASFIHAMKQRHPAKSLVMNAVGSYGSAQIAGTGEVDFLYNELWGDEAKFEDLRTIILANDQYSNHAMRTVFAAYMNYDKAGNSTGEFNTPGVLLTDAVMFALGGSHLELGDHMLCREYFPSAALQMSEELKSAIVCYYDFLTAYQNLLRDKDTSAEMDVELTCTDSSRNLSINAWPPKKSALTAYGKQVDSKQVIHLLNFLRADELSWRDLKGTMPAPRLQTKVPLKLSVKNSVKKIWVASPDVHAGAVQEVAFEQSNGVVNFTLPYLKYWTMIVVE